jgi:hypothetical protein
MNDNMTKIKNITQRVPLTFQIEHQKVCVLCGLCYCDAKSRQASLHLQPGEERTVPESWTRMPSIVAASENGQIKLTPIGAKPKASEPEMDRKKRR